MSISVADHDVPILMYIFWCIFIEWIMYLDVAPSPLAAAAVKQSQGTVACQASSALFEHNCEQPVRHTLLVRCFVVFVHMWVACQLPCITFPYLKGLPVSSAVVQQQLPVGF
jgi:hypothetical protein